MSTTPGSTLAAVAWAAGSDAEPPPAPALADPPPAPPVDGAGSCGPPAAGLLPGSSDGSAPGAGMFPGAAPMEGSEPAAPGAVDAATRARGIGTWLPTSTPTSTAATTAHAI